jgi:hypothetical protein
LKEYQWKEFQVKEFQLKEIQLKEFQLKEFQLKEFQLKEFEFPLTYVTADSKDVDELMLFNFLCPGVTVASNVHIIHPGPPGSGNDLRCTWQKTRSLIDELWVRWSVTTMPNNNHGIYQMIIANYH